MMVRKIYPLLDDWIRVAVAMKWSAAAEAEAMAAKRGDIDWDMLSEDDEWNAWAETFDFVHAGSSASFTGTDGIRRWVGIGYADIEGKKGLPATAAMRTARQTAGTELAYALFGEAESQSVAKRLREKISSADEGLEALTADEFENRVSLAVKGKTVQDSEVYTTTFVHPLSGRKIFVSVVGIEPRDLAEMKLLGESVRGSSAPNAEGRHDGKNVRPDHGNRPASNRPDHSFRPKSNRPEHQ